MTSALRSDQLTDNLYMVIGGVLAQWEGNPERLWRQWRSKLFVLPRPTCMEAMQVVCEDYDDVTIMLYGDDQATPFFTKVIFSEMEFLLPSMAPGNVPAVYTRLAVEAMGRSRVRHIQLATSMEELDV